MIRTAITVLVTLMLATVIFALLGIWLGDGRWGWTAAVSFVLTFLVTLLMMIFLDEADRR